VTSSTTPTEDLGTSYRIRRLTVLVIALGLFAAVIWFFAIREDDDTSGALPTADLALHGWAPYWALEHSIPELELRAENFDEVSPFWFQTTGIDTIVADPSAPERRTERFVDTARELGVALVPSILDAMPAGEMADILADPATRARHVDAIVEFAAEGDYAGVDIDYEQFAFADGRDTWEDTRPNWVAFIEELSAELHGDDRTLTVSIPPVYDADRTDDSGFWVYDYEAITPHVDSIRVMAYDYSTAEPGPISPINWVQDAIEGTIEASGDPSKLVLGLPLYGYNWPVDVEGDCPSDAPERTSVTIRSLPGLLADRSAEPQWVERTAEYTFTYDLTVEGEGASCVQTREVHYVDAVGAQMRLELAKEAGFGGISLWAFGYEDGSVWNRISPSLSPTDTTTVVSATAAAD
jgi:spore germination protein YaaH